MQSVILGTAQWGLDYGVTNVLGRIPDVDLARLIEEARRTALSRLDTAPGYGDAEERIGLVASDFAVQTKMSAGGASDSDFMISVRRSLARLRVERLAAVLIHDWHELDEEARVSAAGALMRARGTGLVEAVGVSVYGEEDLASAASAFDPLDVVQVPVSVLDQRLDGSEAVASMRRAGTKVQARSVFLQGVALASDENSAFGSHPDVLRLRESCVLAGIDPVDLCLGYVRSLPWVDEVVIAATSALELRSLMQSWAAAPVSFNWSSLGSVDVDLIDPRRWHRPRQGMMTT